MIGFDLILATVLLTTPDIECPAPPVPIRYFQTVALSLELIGEKERTTWFAEAKDWRIDWDVIHRAGVELRDAPPACDAVRFPNGELCRELIAANEEYAEFLRGQHALYPREIWYDDALMECAECAAPWSLVARARSEWSNVRDTRQALQDLREMIGPRLYYSGCLPPHIPVWRLQRIDD